MTSSLPLLRPWWSQELATVRVLVWRDMLRFFRERSRIAGALLQPLFFWLVLGAGLSPTFRLASAPDVGYGEYFFPGIVLLVVLFAAIFATMSVIEDRHAGFLQAVLVAPGSRAAVVAGKCLGSTLVALVQAVLFVALAPLAGFPFSQILWAPLVATVLLSCLGLTLLGFAIAWWLDSTQGYHVVMSVVLLPLWVLSGAMFSVPAEGAFRVALALNPVAYAVAGVRRALSGGGAPPGTVFTPGGAAAELAVLLAFAILAGVLAVTVCRKRP